MALDNKFTISLQSNLAKGTGNRLQQQLDAISKKELTLKIGKVQIENQQFTKSVKDAARVYEQEMSRAINNTSQKQQNSAKNYENFWIKSLRMQEIKQDEIATKQAQKIKENTQEYKNWWTKAIREREIAENKANNKALLKTKGASSSVSIFDDLKKTTTQSSMKDQLALLEGKFGRMTSSSTGIKIFDEKSVKNVNKDIESLSLRIKDITNNRMAQQWQADFGKVQTTTKLMNGQLVEAKAKAKSFGEEIVHAGQKMLLWAGIGGVIFGTMQQIQKGVQYIIQMDTAMTNLAKVVDLTKKQLMDMSVSAVEAGKKLGASSIDVMNAYAEFGRVTKNPEEIKQLSTAAILASNVTTLTAEQSAKAINTTMIAFKKEAKESIGIIDKWNELQNNLRKNYAESKSALIDLEVLW